MAGPVIYWIIFLMIPVWFPVQGDVDHQLKKTYCNLNKKSRVFREEQLDVHCAGKVNLFEDRVSFTES